MFNINQNFQKTKIMRNKSESHNIINDTIKKGELCTYKCCMSMHVACSSKVHNN